MGPARFQEIGSHSHNLTIGIVLFCERGPLQWCGLSVSFLLSCFRSFVVDRLSFFSMGHIFLLPLSLLPLGFYSLHLPFVDIEI